jgi:hypothetical protein
MARVATEKTWAERVTRWEQSGQTAKVFAAQEGVRAQSLSWWKWKLRQGATGQSVAQRAQVVPLSFVRLEPTAPEESPEALPLEVVLASGNGSTSGVPRGRSVGPGVFDACSPVALPAARSCRSTAEVLPAARSTESPAVAPRPVRNCRSPAVVAPARAQLQVNCCALDPLQRAQATRVASQASRRCLKD